MAELLQAIQQSPKPGLILESSSVQGDPRTIDITRASHRETATIWRWLTARNDVSVGPDRKYNHLSLDEILALVDSSLPGLLGATDGLKAQTPDADGPAQNNVRLPTRSTANDLRVFVSEECMWESITGHSVDYRRIPKSEWLLLLGIASSKSEGILQGDLGRLVDQDKRSVPKRTDSLTAKGYITKRTTLVRGTKTSKIWLKIFAPTLPKDTSSMEETSSKMNLSRQVLVDSLEPVPWHVRWTGDSIDYTALATTIMAITKEWGVLRMQDLKTKLGILGMRWQMKVLSKTCRLLNSLGAIQYVAAKLEERIFKDCVKYLRDLNANDWSIYLATGKKATKVARRSDLDPADDGDELGGSMEQQGSAARLFAAPPWSLDKPLPEIIATTIRSFGESGLTNPDVYALTLGPSFCRFLSSMTATLATPNLQPPSLGHLQMSSEHIRTGKIASYRYVVHRGWPVERIDGAKDGSRAMSMKPLPVVESTDVLIDSFKASSVARPDESIASLMDLCGLSMGRKKKRGRPRKVKPADIPITDQSTVPEHASTESHRQSSARRDTSPTQEPGALAGSTIDSASVVPVPDSLEPSSQPPSVVSQRHTRSMRSSPPQSIFRDSSSAVNDENPVPDEQVTSDVSVDNQIDSTPRSGRGRGRGRGRSRGLGRGRPTSAAVPSASRAWKCEKCGGSWKNEGGLKYHLEKSKTSCNPSYDTASPQRKPGRYGSLGSFPNSDHIAEHDGGVTRTSHHPAWQGGAPRNNPTFDSNQAGARRNDYVKDAKKPAHVFPTLETKDNGDYASPGTVQDALIPIEVGRIRQVSASRHRASESRLIESAGVETMNYPRSQTADLDDNEHATLQMKLETQPHQNPNVTMFYQNPADAMAEGSQMLPIPNDSLIGASPNKMMTANSSPRDELLVLTSEKDKIRSVVLEMLENSSGAILGGEPLWHAIMDAWTAKFPHHQPPDAKSSKSALSALLKSNTIMEHWHGFRTSTGKFSKCQVIMMPGIDAFSPEALRIVERVKNPNLAVTTSERTEKSPSKHMKEKPRGRRPLADEVAVLDAPVYAAQLVAKRALENSPETPRLTKRQKRSAMAADEYDLVDSTRLYDPQQSYDHQVRRATGDRRGEDGDRALKDSIPDSPGRHPGISIQFLPPNTHSEYEVLDTPGKSSSQLETTQTLSPIASTRKVDNTVVAGLQRIKFAEITSLQADSKGKWPFLEALDLEGGAGSYTMQGWMPNAKWFAWASFIRETDRQLGLIRSRRQLAKSSADTHYEAFLDKLMASCAVEMCWKESFVKSLPGEAGPHNIFIHFIAPACDTAQQLPKLQWPAAGQSNLGSTTLNYTKEDSWASLSSDNEFESISTRGIPSYGPRPGTTRPVKQRIKRVALVTRELTTIPADDHIQAQGADEEIEIGGTIQDPAETLAAFIAVRVLLGGADRAIDWGLLVHMFPHVGLDNLRRFWISARKEQGPLISKYTRAFQVRFPGAYEYGEVPVLDFENLLDYDWHTLIQWTMQISHEEEIQLPVSKTLLHKQYTAKALTNVNEDWREKFFHVQTSVFSRFEVATSEPGAIGLTDLANASEPAVSLSEIDLTRSWVKSLCCTSDTKYSPEQVRDRFLALFKNNEQHCNTLLKEAVEQLTFERAICKSKKPPLGGRPYRLNEWYVLVLGRLAQRDKYRDAAMFKTELDTTFRRNEAMKIPYTLSDGAAMALTNLSACRRVKMCTVDVPYIPFGFEPGNYESRKFPKSYYHFGLEVMPTETYLFDEHIDVLKAVIGVEPPKGSESGEMPQWIDFFGDADIKRWSDVLGAFCFLLATRGPMTIEGFCKAMEPVLEPFEAETIIKWGKETGVLKDLMSGAGTTLGEWWWLAVPRLEM